MLLAPRKKILNGIVDAMVKPARQVFKNIFGAGSSLSVEENLLSAPVPLVNPRDIPRIPEEDQLLKDDEVLGELPEAEVQGELPEADEVQIQFPEADKVQDLKDRLSYFFEDEDDENPVIHDLTKLFFDGGKELWVAKPHVRVWSNRSFATV